MKHVYVAVAAGLLGWGLTGLVLAAVRKSQHLAPPSERGLHQTPTPVGGGLGLMGATLAMWAIGQWPLSPVATTIFAAMIALAFISWWDDRQPLPPIVRFAAQIIVVFLVLWNLPVNVRLFPGLPSGLERAGLAIAWLWMINLTNFMDGIDGLAGTEAISIGLGYVLLVTMVPGGKPLLSELPELALILAAAAIGYLFWNWAPAKIFMGDTGSIPLGFVFGLLMLDLTLRGQWAAAIILPLYFIFDATLTLLDRLGRRVKPWEAHREHAYQRAVLAGMTHAAVTKHVAVLNIALVALAILSASYQWESLAAAVVLTLLLRTWLHTRQVRGK